MASYSPKRLEKKYNNWVKAQLALLFTKDGLEPFVCHEVQEFQLKCLDGIWYSNGLISGTLCSNCCTENVIKCPTNTVCNVRRGRCSYHRNAATRYNPAGCPNKICHNFTTEIQNAHRYSGPSYKNADATQWCSNSWEVAKCFMPDGYKDKAYATETDFNGIISVILNYKDFQMKIHENLINKTNMFEEAREIGRKVRHSSTLEVEDSNLQKYFKLLQKLLSDQVYLATDTHAQKAKRKLTELENDTLVIGKDDIRQALDDVAKAIQDKMKAGLDEHYDRIKLDMIKRRQEDLKSLHSQIAEGVTQLKDEADASVKRLNEERDKEVEKIREQGDKERAALAGLGETLQIRLKIASKDEKEKQYIEFKQRLKDELITWYNANQRTVPLSPLTDDSHTPLAEFYIMPEIDKQTYLPGGRKETTRVKSLQELFTTSKKVSQEIYLSAAAGFGKTSFSKYLAITWCQAHKKDKNYNHFKEEDLKALSGFEFLFLVLLRDSAKVCDVDDMIEQQIIQYLSCSSSMLKDHFQDILRHEKCLVILDGLDEWTHPDNDCIRLPKSIPHRYAREKCVILTTIRKKKTWDRCIERESESDANILLEREILPSKSELNTACHVFGRDSEVVSRICSTISQHVRKRLMNVIDVWPSYKENNESIIFIVILKNKSTFSVFKDYEYLVRCENDVSTEGDLVAEYETKDRTMNQFDNEILEKLRKSINDNADDLFKRHSNINVILPSLVKSVGYEIGQHDIKQVPCIALYVAVKGCIPLNEIPFQKNINDFPTDVLEGVFEPFMKGPNDYHEHLKIGLAIHANVLNGDGILGGTLGGFIDHSMHGLCGLTCAHVVYNTAELMEIKDKKQCSLRKAVYQPIGERSSAFGEVVHAVYDNGSPCSSGVEVALISIHNRQPKSGSFPETMNDFEAGFDAINPLCFNSGAVCETSEIRRRTEVYKFGMSSEITRGSFALQGAVVRKSQMQGQCHGFGFKLMNQMVVLKIGDNPFAEPGDSGALALIEGGQDSIAIGIVEGGMNGRVFVTPICDILRAVGCTELKMHRFTRKCTQLSPDSAEEMEI